MLMISSTKQLEQQRLQLDQGQCTQMGSSVPTREMAGMHQGVLSLNNAFQSHCVLPRPCTLTCYWLLCVELEKIVSPVQS